MTLTITGDLATQATLIGDYEVPGGHGHIELKINGRTATFSSTTVGSFIGDGLICAVTPTTSAVMSGL